MKEAACVLLIHPETLKIVLVNRKNSNQVGMPGGKVDPGESLKTAALRELKEETGIDLPNTKDIIPIFVGVCDGEVPYRTTCYYSLYSGDIPQGQELDINTRWGDLDELVYNSPFSEYNLMVLDHLYMYTSILGELSNDRYID